MISNELTPGTAALHAKDSYGADIECELKPDQGVFVGRSSNCGLKLRGEGLSDIHCRVGLEGGKLWIQDWMSASGTRVNGQQIATKTEIRNGDVVGVGPNEITVMTGDMSDAPTNTAPTSTETTNTLSTSNLLTSAIDDISNQIDDCVAISPDQDEQLDDQPDHSNLLSAFQEEPQTDSSSSDMGSRSGDASNDSGGFDFGDDVFGSEEDVTYDRETVALLEAEIEDLRSALAQRDAEPIDHSEPQPTHRPAEEASDEVLNRMQELIDEANRSDERAAILEEALQAAEEANQSEQEERTQLEAWVGDIEKRVGQREEEHLAEIEAMRQRMDESSKQQELLQRKLREAAATSGSAPKHYEETLENLQEDNKKLQEKLAGSKKQLKSREQKLERKTEVEDPKLREERANLAQEQARISRMRFQLSDKLAAIDELPKTENPAEKETAERIHTLREHLRDIYEQEKQEEKEATLGTRLAKLWKRVDYEY